MAKGITIAARKQKARLLQQLVRDKILELDSRLVKDDDVRSTPMGNADVDIQLSTAAKEVFPFAVECKASESVSLWAAFEQAEQHAAKNQLMPLAVMKRNRTKALAILTLDDFFKLLSQKGSK